MAGIAKASGLKMAASFPGPWNYPEITRLDGNFVTVERVDPLRDGEDLYNLSHCPPAYQSLFDYMSFGPFPSQDAMAGWLAEITGSRDPLYFTVLDKSRNMRVGMASLLNIAPAHGRVELGNIWYSPLVQKTQVNTEVTYLFLKSLFDEYHYRRVEWKCDNENTASKRAALRLGFVYEGLFRQHMVIKGKNRDTAWYAMLDGEWPSRKKNFEAYLSGAAESLARLNDQPS